MMKNAATQSQQIKSGVLQCLALVNPSRAQIQAKFEVAVENKQMEYNHPMIYETFK